MSDGYNFHHIVFRTKGSEPTLPELSKRTYLSYIYHVAEDMGGKVLRLNCYLNHVHLFVSLPFNLDLSTFVKKVKGASSRAMNGNPACPNFVGWARKFGSFSKSVHERDMIINYIRGQEEHHRYKTFQEELMDMFGSDFFNSPYNRHDWLDEPLPPSVEPANESED
ncbi:MAG: transposase [Bacteroidales bacterium]|nr:transposase [Bacteroidales bacterium]MCD8393458.1 transposase [Bacteroidales bacterium]